jgi:DNA-binding transcriptional MerR regulator
MSGGELDLAEELPDKLFFRIGEAAELVGVEPHVLRYWETEFRLRPQRSTSGQRMYRRADIGRFLKIRRLLHEEGFTILGARKLLLGEGAEAPAALASVDPARLHQAMVRLESARQRVAALRQRLTQVGPGTALPSGALAPPRSDG